MPFTKDQIQSIGEDENKRWTETYASIKDEIKRTQLDLKEDKKEAIRLTSEIVGTTRDEEKAALASDEAVAHGLVKLRKEKTGELDSLLDQPYFARVVTEEDGKKIEFKLGTASFPRQRIIDWRKAPISQLYYDYAQGEDFSETIQGRDREGIIKLRRGYQGETDQLEMIEAAEATLVKDGTSWKTIDPNQHLSRDAHHDGRLPPILSLITPEQFKLITKDASKPVIIQGIAGSGKTTVALHRLAWLLHEDNSDAQPNRCLVVMFNRSLKAYVESTLPELNIQDVPIRTFYQWAGQILGDIMGPRPKKQWEQNNAVAMFKSSSICLQKLNEYTQANPASDDSLKDLFDFFKFLNDQDLFWPQWDAIKQRLNEQITQQKCDYQDDSLLLHLIYQRHGRYPTKKAQALTICDHIVIDEAQDFGLVEIKALLNALNKDKTITLVGDIGQRIAGGRNFGSWDNLLKDVGLKEVEPISLTVSHRSTIEIMEMAASLRSTKDDNPISHAGRHGHLPTFIRADHAQVLTETISRWIKQRLQESPRTFCAVICRWPKQAERLTNELRKLGHPEVRWGHRDRFDFSPGVTITNAHQVKGLEFRDVLIVEPSEENYSVRSEEERNLLYVALTRAQVYLDFVGTKRPTKLLPELEKGSV